MARKKGRRKRHIPQRTCVGCRETSAKGDLLRLVRTSEGVFADPSGKMNGRGAYVHANQECLASALKGGLEQSLRVSISKDDRERLLEESKKLPAKKEIKAATNAAENT